MGRGYKHAVFGRGFLIQLALVIAVVAPFIVLFANRTSVWLTVAVVGGIFVLLFHAMTVEVEGQMLRFWFGPGLLKREIPIADIEKAEKKYTPWFWGTASVVFQMAGSTEFPGLKRFSSHSKTARRFTSEQMNRMH